MSGSIEHRCRRCGQVTCKETQRAGAEIVRDLLLHGESAYIEFEAVKAVDVHTCPDGGVGVLELLGAAPLREGPPLLAEGWTVVSWKRDQTDRAWVLCAVHEDIGNGTIGWWYLFDDTGQWDLMSSTTGTGSPPDREPPLREDT